MSIEVKGLYKSFDGVAVLKDIDFTFETGKINMIIGASGSGKTVLLKCMVGLMRPEKGSINYDGNEVLDLNYKEMREVRKQIGMLFQGAALFDSLSVYDNVAFPLRMFTKLGERQIARKVVENLERVNLPHAAKKFPAEISGGMKKRVGIARALVLDPRYLFCDEPNSGLDPETAEVIDQLIRRLTDELEMTTIVVSHDIKSVISIGDKILFIYQGHKEWEGSREDIHTATNETLLKFIEISGVIEAFGTRNASHQLNPADTTNWEGALKPK